MDSQTISHAVITIIKFETKDVFRVYPKSFFFQVFSAICYHAYRSSKSQKKSSKVHVVAFDNHVLSINHQCIKTISDRTQSAEFNN